MYAKESLKIVGVVVCENCVFQALADVRGKAIILGSFKN